MGKKSREQRRASERASARLRAAEAARRRRRLAWAGGASVVAVGLAVGLGVSLGGSGGPNLKLAPLSSLGRLDAAPSPGPVGPEGVPIPRARALAGTTTEATGQIVDGISCSTTEQTLFHVHTHLTIFVDGHPRQVPYGIGIAPPRRLSQTPEGPFVSGGSCFYWLHTHAADGVIHIESPLQRTFTLGEFFGIWGEPLSSHQVGRARGKVTAFYNGQVYRGNPRNIPIGDHVQVQLDVGSPLVAPEHITFPPGV